MSHLTRETKDLLERGRGGEPLREVHRRRLKRAILWKAGLASLMAAASPAAAWTSGAVKVVAVVSAVAVTGGAAFVGTHVWRGRTEASGAVTPPPSTPRAAPVAAPSPVVTSPAPPALAPETVVFPGPPPPSTLLGAAPTRRHLGIASPISAPPIAPATPAGISSVGVSAMRLGAPEEAPLLAAAPTVVASSEPVADRASSLESEARLLRTAHAALARGDADTALHLLDEHAARYPDSVLEPERSAERIFALCTSNAARRSEASSAAKAFLARHPAGPLAARVRASCGGVND